MIESEVSEMIVHAKEVGSIIIGAVEEDEGRPQLSDMAAYLGQGIVQDDDYVHRAKEIQILLFMYGARTI